MENEITGTFNGQTMDADDGRQYPVPSNYASKSRLVCGDRLKLTMDNGQFIYKQIQPMERKNVIAKYVWDDILKRAMFQAGDRYYKVLPQSVSYYGPSVGDEVVLIVPRGTESEWAALEAVITPKRQTYEP